jgi:antitoxin VapB
MMIDATNKEAKAQIGEEGRGRAKETPSETAARLRAQMGIELSEQATIPLPRSVYDEMSGE